GYVAGWPHITVLDEIKGASAYEFYEPSERYSTKSDLFNVRAYGAKGNGSADDTEAFLKALEAARKNGGGIVFVPSGKYSVSSRLEVPQNTEILGEWYGYRTGSPSQINVRYQGGGNDYFIGLSAGSGVQGITFYLPDNKPESYAAPTGDSYGYANGSAYDPTTDVFPTEALGIAPRPYLIRGRGDSVWAENICITNGYNGIDLKSERCDNFVVRGVWGTCMNSGIEVGGGSENGQISCVFFTFGTWWESIARRIDLSCYTYENAKGFTFGNCRNIMALSASTFGLCECLRFVKEGDGEPENISVARALMDTPYGHVCLKIDAGDDLSFVGVSSGTHPTEANGRISSAVTVGENFAGKARIYGQNIWAGCENVLRGDAVVYTGGETSAETISHNFSFGNYLTEFTFGEDSGADVAKTSSPAEKTGCGGTLDSAAFIWVATVLSVCVIKKQKKEKQYEEKY
ncbi:MAG: hypothetical protein IJU84_05940, partial [Clostridia bacterium]|nr:hypothetical protein [Clostridia bacterium]